MHLHLHFKETVLNFGPVYGYRLFSFERYNGVLKNYTTNNKDGFEGTFMRRYLEDTRKIDLFHTTMQSLQTPSQVSLIYDLVDSFLTLVTVTAATTTTIVPTALYLSTTSSGFNLKIFLASAEVNINNVKGNKPLRSSVFPLSLDEVFSMKEDEYVLLLELYCMAYSNTSLRGYQDVIFGQLFMNNMIQKMQPINLLGQVYKGSNGIVRHGSIIQAMFHENNNHEMSAFTGQIQYLFVSNIINPVTYQVDRHIFAYFMWYRTSSQDTRSEQFVEMSEFLFTRSNFQNILSAYRILMPAAIGVHTTATGNTHMLIAPLYRKIYA
ncbi:hypothetical protein PHYBLDRAFT_71522 [Phycomyces blakesleeanus NRRL 1555(-)]|uniref:Uncharacterized protein n=1 Tax=Phycomyces blakesleeanus (strain ATCC 8743b / DSM 1359 / FGSC 10004 / NBRC 33097 / NRRL 1555) TaxID=763407 RepID=A0A162TV67_PHYB8|nr:hypothetical protein PHYBLDRAFT_71522 [Phycomyces blakesleeanus NRRL 1555(-)]OAD70083.1 hypothetical protein PHYBLDRAFT_71522 [Phycomyces blakesleeanus NRRL 1555(-)]|eukprot:XP_018288123.1 hypothetical protein PHYBLDRAFT_71522 [Phycomyces blakesleeanus NRRL 1555(-)]